MSYLENQILEGQRDLSAVPTSRLLEWLETVTDYRIRDLIGCELCYRQ